MNDLAELKEFVVVHARGQRIPDHQQLLDRIHTDEGGGPGSWAGEWSAAGRRLIERDMPLEACRYFAMARFPFVDGPARQEAQNACVDAFDRWRSARPELGIESLEVELPGGRMRCWATGLDAADPRPLLVITGGIVSVKELWAPVLTSVRHLGMAAIVAELPGIGENPLRYGPKSSRMLSWLLDAVADRAEVARTYALALSFSGHLALGCAAEDSRIRGVVTAGAPVSAFFQDREWQRTVPRVTVDTLAHLRGIDSHDRGEVLGSMGEFALDGALLEGLRIPVRCVVSGRDEIIPAADPAALERHVRDVGLLTIDDVHGSPAHTAETRMWCVRALVRMRGLRGPKAAAVDLAWRGMWARRRLGGALGRGQSR
ncbi:alpha/beta hydrolase [Streptomyces sp. NBC_01187]|uniref:alpha/beta hydrolase n=1 Tax=Streptomyces sp. NBC_01187 TaxID=2903766 RepID=UPI003863A4A3|nr:alpha/beta hydrolase [Streptomyces sp. NBC_01187]